MKCILRLTFLFNLPVFAIAGIEESGIYKASNVRKVHFLASKYNPHFVPCKYGVELAFDQAHFVAVPNSTFTTKRECPSGCETMTVKLPGTSNEATVCCLPETPWKHLKTVSVSGGLGEINADGIADNLKTTHWLALAFPDIVPKNKKRSPRAAKYVPKKKTTKNGANIASIGYAVVGAAIAQSVVLGMVVATYFLMDGRIELGLPKVAPPISRAPFPDAPPDCDYIIQPEIKIVNPSKSGMLSENMNSDLMSMSQGAL